ncbi:MAG: hypothetical protein H6Q00_1593 [Holophagaceae bacterium]|nr:hypothetical protein [Holophagaceae bacterium]
MAKSKQRKKANPADNDKLIINRASNMLKNGFQWKVNIQKGSNKCEVISDIYTKTHFIKIPQNDPTNGLNLLHELCHAHLSEHGDPCFLTPIFAIGTKQQDILDITSVLTASCDWFVEEIEYSLARIPFLKEVEWFTDNFKKTMHSIQNKSNQDRFLHAFLIAQAHRYLHTTIPVDGILSEMVSAFLETDPSQPSLKNLLHLVNKLLSIQDKSINRIRGLDFVLDGECYAWKIIPQT